MAQIKRLPITPQEKAEAFKNWYSAQGHWVYETRAEAVSVWRERGILGRPQHSQEIESLLREWVACDPVPALVLKLFSQHEHEVRREHLTQASEIRRAARGAL